MWVRCVAKCGSSFHLEELDEICCEGKKLEENKNTFLFNNVSIRMYLNGPKHLILNVYAAETAVVMLYHLCVFSFVLTLTLSSEPSSFPSKPSTSLPGLLM